MAEAYIRRSRDTDETLDLLVKDGPFKTAAEVQAFAAALAWSRDARRPVDKPGKDPVRYSIYVNAGLDGLIQMMAATSVEDPKVLSYEQIEEQTKIFEEYAHAGLLLLRDLIKDPSKKPAEVIVDLVLDARQGESEGGEDSIEDMADELF